MSLHPAATPWVDGGFDGSDGDDGGFDGVGGGFDGTMASMALASVALVASLVW